jgi:hypothetical protein
MLGEMPCNFFGHIDDGASCEFVNFSRILQRFQSLHDFAVMIFQVLLLASGENNHFGSGDFDQFLVKQK